MIPISAYFSRRGPKREIQSNQASCTHTPSTTDSYSCYVSAELSFIQLDLCEKTPICQFMYLYLQYEIILQHIRFTELKCVYNCMEQSIFSGSQCSEVVAAP